MFFTHIKHILRLGGQHFYTGRNSIIDMYGGGVTLGSGYQPMKLVILKGD